MDSFRYVAVALFAANTLAWNHSTPEQLSTQLSNDDYTLVAFVAPETEASKTLLPEWQALAGLVPNARSVDCTVSQTLCNELDVVGYPTIRLYRDQKNMSRYRGPRKASSIASYFRRRQQPALVPLTTKTLESFSKSDDFVFIAHVSPQEQGLLDRLSAVAEVYRDRYTFGYLADAEDHEGNSLQCYNNVDGLHNAETDVTRAGAVQGFVETCAELLIPQLTRKNELKYIQTGKSLVYYFTDDEADQESYTSMMKPLATTYREYLSFVTVDTNEYRDMSRAMGISATKGLVVENTHTGQLFPYRGSAPIAPDEISLFINGISQGSIQPWNGHSYESTSDAQPSSGDSKTSQHDEL